MPQLRYPRVDLVDVRQGSPDTGTHIRVTQPCDTCQTWDWCRLRQACWAIVKAELAEPTRSMGWRDWTPELVCQALRDHADADGTPPLAEDWMHATRDTPGYTTVKRLFGGWNQAVRAAGLEPRRNWRM